MTDPLMDPRLADCRRLVLREHELRTGIGVHDFELGVTQRLLVSVDLYVPLALSTPRADRLDEVVDYDFIRREIADCVSRGHIGLQETLADELLRRMLAHPGVRAARVATAKPDVYPDCAAVGVEVFAFRQDPR